MLANHLSQDHDWASRRIARIDEHVAWLHDACLARRPSRILDLGCGPGLYLDRLVALGHRGVGIDFSPASIAYARTLPHAAACDYRLADLTVSAFETGFDLVMMLFGEINVFPPETALSILQRVRAALRPGGMVVLEVHDHDYVEASGQVAATWTRNPDGGLFSAASHILLVENAGLAEAKVAATDFWVQEEGHAEWAHYRSLTQAYGDDGYAALFSMAGFSEPVRETHVGHIADPDFFMLRACREIVAPGT
ncbi:class I SAM-dependent methyltransferase [Telmatospirillum sp.]|uniref:class I SAM-dependent methyltransferase n=1 Tax=Telmatospirillum sp. TaxID=2079197 RepID=UPI00284838BD|nr:class I SAM-dependent methyltransferase [Telmatospirillum sp.]MDR3436774.1 class I SAM-dependent methyltransferase [Telmatospirillum sp.]